MSTTGLDAGSGEHFELQPEDSVTFALPAVQPPAQFKADVLRVAASLDWSKYLTLPPALRANLPWCDDAWDVRYARGAEHALEEILRMRSARTLFVPRFSYPGYARICRRLGLCIEFYDRWNDLHSALSRVRSGENAVVVTSPGNPIDSDVNPEGLSRDFPRELVIVDATYANPIDPRFMARAKRLCDAGVLVVLSFSKRLHLAGIRLGATLVPIGMTQLPEEDPRMWTALSAAALQVLSEKPALDMIRAVQSEQSKLCDRLESSLSKNSLGIVSSSSRTFVSIDSRRSDPGKFDWAGRSLRGKSWQFDGDQILRIDACEFNLSKFVSHGLN